MLNHQLAAQLASMTRAEFGERIHTGATEWSAQYQYHRREGVKNLLAQTLNLPRRRLEEAFVCISRGDLVTAEKHIDTLFEEPLRTKVYEIA